MARQPTPILPQTNDDISSFRSGRTSRSNRSFSSGFFGSKMRQFKPSHNTGSFKIPLLVRRFFKPPTLDFETAMWEMVYLLISPKKVYKSLYYQKQTKNRWARDDPSFVILLSALITLSAIAWGVAYSPGFFPILRLILYMVFVDFFIVGFVLSTICWVSVNRFLSKKGRGQETIGAVTEGDLEWGYCFDVHCNSYLIIWINLYLVQFVLLPVLKMDNFISLFLGNALYFGSWCYYIVITFYGYNLLPFLEHTQLILFPIAALGVLFFFSLFGFNLTKTITDYYFS